MTSLIGFNFLFLLGTFLLIVSVGAFVWYVYVEYFSYKFGRRKTPPYLKGIVDSEGRVILSSLSSIWYENEKRSSFSFEDYTEAYSEGVKKGVDKALEQVAKEFFEPKVFSDSISHDGKDDVEVDSRDPVDALFENLPPRTVIELIIPSVLKLDLPYLEGLSEEEKNILYKRFLDRLMEEENFKRVGDITPSVGEKIYREEVEKFIGVSSGGTEGEIEEKEDSIDTITMENLLVKDLDNRSKSYQSDFSSSSWFADFFVNEIGLSIQLVNSLRLSEPDLVLLEARMDFLAIPEVKALLNFMIKLHEKNKLYLLFSKSYDVSKLFKDYLLYITSCLSDKLFDSPGVDSPVLSYFRNRASYYYSLKMCRFGAYEAAKKGKWGPLASKEVMFLPVISGYLASVERPDLEKEFTDLIISNLNIKVQDMFYRSFTFANKKKGEIDTDDRYFDHLGFSYEGKIYLLPYAVDLWLDYYALAMPYVLSSIIKVDVVFEKPVYVHPYTVSYKDGRNRTFKLSEVTDERDLSKVIVSSLLNKEVKIKDYQNVESIKKISFV